MSLDVGKPSCPNQQDRKNSCLNSHIEDQAAFVILCQNKKRCPDICVRINASPKAFAVLSWLKSCAL